MSSVTLCGCGVTGVAVCLARFCLKLAVLQQRGGEQQL